MLKEKKGAPGEARTHNLRISPILSYKYGALTDCATGATLITNKVEIINVKFYKRSVEII